MLRDGTSSRTGTAPLSINFINSSTGGITAYAWTFGDGTTSTSQHPVHVYPVAGTYTVSLEVTGPGGTNTKTLASYVKLMAPAAADATPPGAPSSVVARASGSTTIHLKRNASADDDGVTGYRIERCQGDLRDVRADRNDRRNDIQQHWTGGWNELRLSRSCVRRRRPVECLFHHGASNDRCRHGGEDWDNDVTNRDAESLLGRGGHHDDGNRHR